MVRSNFKTFIYSFSVSLLVILIAKTFLVSKHKETLPEERLVSNKNIALFLKKEETPDISSTKTPAVLVSNLSDINSHNTNVSDGLLSFFSRQKSKNQDNSSSDIVDIDDDKLTEIFIETAYNDIDAYELASSIISEKSTLQKPIQKSINTNLDEEKISDSSPKFDDKESLKEIAKIFEMETAKLNKEEEQNVAKIEDNLVKDDIIPILWNNGKKSKKSLTIASKIENDNSVAMVDSSVPLKSLMKDDTKGNKEDNFDSPWVVAEGGNASRNSMLQETLNKEDAKKTNSILSKKEDSSKAEIKVSQMVRNILIPIPEDILNDADATPQLVTSEKNKELREKIETNIIQKPSSKTTSVDEKTSSTDVSETITPEKKPEDISAKPSVEVESTPIEDSNTKIPETTPIAQQEDFTPAIKKEKKTIFDSITNIFSNNVKMPEIGISKDKKKENRENTFFGSNTKNDKNSKKVTKILPTEIKLSFQPNRSEISGPTLRWLEAFANKTKEDDSIALEIRIDGTSSFELQQKRLSLLHNILTNKGVNYNKINTVFTAREANSFIIRTVRIEKQATNANVNNRVTSDSKIYQSW